MNFQRLSQLIAGVMVLLLCFPVHEAAHAFAAHKLGDDTAKKMGRLTLNPLKHLDPLGSLMMIASAIAGVGIGWAKPVPINPNNFKKPKLGMGLSSLAGPVSNFIMGYLFMIIYKLMAYSGASGGVFEFFLTLAYYGVILNVGLAVFNFIPVPPLDGSRIFSLLLPEKFYFGIMKYEKYIGIAFIVIIFTGVLDGVISWLNSAMLICMNFLTIYVDLLMGLR